MSLRARIGRLSRRLTSLDGHDGTEDDRPPCLEDFLAADGKLDAWLQSVGGLDPREALARGLQPPAGLRSYLEAAADCERFMPRWERANAQKTLAAAASWADQRFANELRQELAELDRVIAEDERLYGVYVPSPEDAKTLRAAAGL
jgi:hypothetical protein